MSLSEEYYKKLEHNIKEYGLQVQHVFGDELNPSFSYSIGLFETYKHPEIVIVGLGQKTSHIVINNMANEIKNGKRYESFNYYPDILDNYNCYITEIKVAEQEEYVFQAIQHYGNTNFPAIQCIYPTTKGIFPWEKEWEESTKYIQPVLGIIK